MHESFAGLHSGFTRQTHQSRAIQQTMRLMYAGDADMRHRERFSVLGLDSKAETLG